MPTTKDHILAIQILPEEIRWAEIEKRGGRIALQRCGTETLEEDATASPEETQRVCREAISTIWAQTSRSLMETPEILLLFPDSRVTSRYLEVPSDDPERVQQVIGFEVGEEIRLPLEEISWDSLGFQRSETGTRVLWLAARKSSVKEILEDIPERIPVVSVITPALVGSATLATPTISEKPEEAAIVIDVQRSAATLLVQNADGVFYARSVAAITGEDAEVKSNGTADLAQTLSREVTRTLIYARQRFQSLNISRVLVVGEGSESLTKEMRLTRGLRAEAVGTGDTLSSLGLQKKDAHEVPAENACLVAAAIRRLTEGDRVPSFAPPAAVGALSKGMGKLAGVVTARFVGVAALLLALCVGTSVASNIWRNHAIESRQTRTNELLKKVKRLQTEQRILTEIRKESVPFSDVFIDLTEKVPEHITLLDIRLDLETQFTMKGKAQSNQNVDELIKILQEMPYFYNVTVEKTAFEKEGFVFYIEGKLRQGGRSQVEQRS